MTVSILTPLQLDAAAGLLQNQGITVNANMVLAIDEYESTALISPFLNTLNVGAGNTLSGNILSANVLNNLETLAANSCPALSDSVPSAYSSIGNVMTTVILSQANKDICNSSVSQLAQAVDQSGGYASTTSIFINSAVNSQTYLGNTFTTMNNMITGEVTTINLATEAFGQDLQNLGQLINLDNLDNLGSPLALIQQIFSITGTIPVVTLNFVAVGIPTEIVLNLDNPNVGVTDSIQKLMYTAMTQITGNDLAQILSVLKVTTTGITTMADLLNPVKIFPNSYQSLTVPTQYGLRAIYVDQSGSVNDILLSELPPYMISSQV
jgi:type IV secretory pathway VirB2 component (pilin)